MSKQGSSVSGWRFGIVIAIVITAFLLQYFYPAPDKQWISHRDTVTGMHNTATGRWVTEYLKCGHSVIVEDNIDAARLSELMALNPGIQVRQSGQRTVLVTTSDGYCPEDAQHRYMGVWGDYLAIFRGPAGNGEMERITQIRVDNLPQEWQQQLLDGKLVFENELLLLEALDSLDEYQS